MTISNVYDVRLNPASCHVWRTNRNYWPPLWGLIAKLIARPLWGLITKLIATNAASSPMCCVFPLWDVVTFVSSATTRSLSPLMKRTLRTRRRWDWNSGGHRSLEVIDRSRASRVNRISQINNVSLMITGSRPSRGHRSSEGFGHVNRT